MGALHRLPAEWVMLDFVLRLFFEPSYVKWFKDTRPKRGETDAQYVKRLRRMHSYSAFWGEG